MLMATFYQWGTRLNITSRRKHKVYLKLSVPSVSGWLLARICHHVVS